MKITPRNCDCTSEEVKSRLIKVNIVTVIHHQAPALSSLGAFYYFVPLIAHPSLCSNLIPVNLSTHSLPPPFFAQIKEAMREISVFVQSERELNDSPLPTTST